MMRPAKAQDIPVLAELLKGGFARSKYAGGSGVDVNYAKRLLMNMIMNHGLPGEEGTCCMVWEERERVRGIHFAMRQRVYLVGNEFTATDTFFYIEPGCNPFAWASLLVRFLRWAKSDPSVIEIQPGCTDLIPEVPWQKIAAMYERHGFSQIGAIFSRQVERKIA